MFELAREAVDTMSMMDHHHEMEGEPMMAHHEHGSGAMMMKMFFHFGYGDTLLFAGLKIDSSLKLILSCFVLFILAVFLEALNYLRRLKCECELRPFKVVGSGSGEKSDHDHSELYGSGTNGACCQQGEQQQSSRPTTRRCCRADSAEEGLNGAGSSSNDCCSTKHCELSLFRADNKTYRCWQAILYLLQTFLALTLMLAAMTYNVCIIFAIVLGAGLGYYVFYRPIVDVQLCH